MKFIQIEATTYSVETAISAYASEQVSEGRETDEAKETDRFEPSTAVMGAAQNLEKTVAVGAEAKEAEGDGADGAGRGRRTGCAYR